MNREQTEGTLNHSECSLSVTIHLDLKAFEQRLIECVSYTKNKTKKWKGVIFDSITTQAKIEYPSRSSTDCHGTVGSCIDHLLVAR